MSNREEGAGGRSDLKLVLYYLQKDKKGDYIHDAGDIAKLMHITPQRMYQRLKRNGVLPRRAGETA